MTADSASYVIVGNGRWAGVIRQCLKGTHRRVSILTETRRAEEEPAGNYQARIAKLMSASRAAIAWICIPPCPEVPLIIEAAIGAGLHVIVEKPWMYPRETAESLTELARVNRVLVGIHFQYCLLEAVETLKLRANTLIDPSFSGTFTVSRHDRLGIPALDNLGSHLLAVREYAVPNSKITPLHCAYDGKDERFVRIGANRGAIETIQLRTGEPIVERFIAKFEAADRSLNFPFDLRFASSVFEALNTARNKPPTTL